METSVGKANKVLSLLDRAEEAGASHINVPVENLAALANVLRGAFEEIGNLTQANKELSDHIGLIEADV